MSKKTRAETGASCQASVPKNRRFARGKMSVFGAIMCIGVIVSGLPRAFAKPLVISGQIEGYEVHISVPAPLRVTAVHVQEGDSVSQGQTLVELDNSDLKAKNDGTRVMLSALTKERDQLRSAISHLQASIPGKTRESMSVSAGLAKRNKLSPVVHQDCIESTKMQEPNALTSVQLKSLDEETAVQKSELQDGYHKQLNMLESAVKANEDAADKTYQVQKTALEEVKKAKIEAASKRSFFSFLIPRKLRDAKAQAITEVIAAKESALSQGYEASKDAIKRAAETQRKALHDGFQAKQQALDETCKAKRGAIEQVAGAMDALKKTATEQQNQISKQLAGLGGSQGGIGNMIAMSQTGVLTLQLESARTRLLAVESEIAKVKAGQFELDAKSKMLKITSPIAGRCATSNVRVGELPIPGQSIITIVDPTQVYLRAYVPESLLGGVKVGQSAHVRIDYKQAPTLEATVTSIDQKASFTPENVSLPQDRVRQVFGVNLRLKDSGDYAKPGMSADATIETD